MKKLSMILVLLLVAQIGCVAISFGASSTTVQSPSYDKVCKAFANRVFDEYAKFDYNQTILQKVFNEWLKFAENYDESTTTQTDIDRCVATFEAYRAQLNEPVEFTISESEAMAFRKNGLKASDLLSHNIEYREFYKQINIQIDILKESVQYPDGIKLRIEGGLISNELNMLNLEISYYSMLHTFSQLPKSIYDSSMKGRFTKLNYKFDVALDLPTAEYERMCESIIKKSERLVAKEAELLNKLTKSYMVLDDSQVRFNMACEALDEALAALDSIEGIFITESDTKESAREKIEYVTAVINNMEACGNEYIESMTICHELIGADMEIVESERESFENVISDYREAINYMKGTYELLGFGKFE